MILQLPSAGNQVMAEELERSLLVVLLVEIELDYSVTLSVQQKCPGLALIVILIALPDGEMMAFSADWQNMAEELDMDIMNKSLVIVQIQGEIVKKLMDHVKSGDFCGIPNAKLDTVPSDVASADLAQAQLIVLDLDSEEDLIFHVLKRSSLETL